VIITGRSCHIMTVVKNVTKSVTPDLDCAVS
jgi:hypothetical protein